VDPKSQYIQAGGVTDQGSLIQLGSPITGFLVSSAPGTSPDNKVPAGITKIHGILARFRPLRIRLPRILIGSSGAGDRGIAPVIPSPNFHLDSHWKVGHWASQKRPGPVAPVPDGMDPAPRRILAPAVMGSLDSRPSL
jgi:hypothetical protein